MERHLAERVLEELQKSWGSYLSLLEVMAMTKVMSDGYEIYAITKGDVTIMAWIQKGGHIVIQSQCW